MKIEERIDLLKKELQKQSFLEMKGLGNEVPFFIFDYPAEEELLIRETTKKLIDTFSKKDIKILNINLYELSLDILHRRTSSEKIIEFEKKKGSDQLLKKLQNMLKMDLLNEEVISKLNQEDYNLVFLTGVGNVWPLIRSHKILNNLQKIMKNVPLIVFYPGKYNKSDLSLFNKFKDTNYYRAFRLIDYVEGVN